VRRCLDIVELRRYQDAHDAVENSDSGAKLPQTPMIQNVVMAQVAIQKENREERVSGR
jgi:hypothetical protein